MPTNSLDPALPSTVEALDALAQPSVVRAVVPPYDLPNNEGAVWATLVPVLVCDLGRPQEQGESWVALRTSAGADDALTCAKSAALSTVPSIRARLYHFASTQSGAESGVQRALAAQNYLEVALDEHADLLDRITAALWVQDLSKNASSTDLAATAIALAIDLAKQAIANPNHMCQAEIIDPLDALSQLQDPPGELLDLLNAARVALPDPSYHEMLSEYELRMLKGEEKASRREELRSADARYALDYALATDVVSVRRGRLYAAGEMASRLSQHDVAKEISRELEALGTDDFGTFPFDYELTDALPWVHAIDDCTSLGSMLDAIVTESLIITLGPELTADGKQTAHVFSLIFGGGHTIVDEAGHVLTPYAAVVDPDLAVTMAMQGHLYAAALHLLGKRFAPAETDLFAYFESRCALSTALSLAKAIYSHCNGDYEVAQCVVTPRIETLLHEVALAHGLDPWKPARAEGPGGYMMLGTLLKNLNGEVGDQRFEEMRAFLANGHGTGLRDRVAHGVVTTYTKGDSALLIACALHALSLTGI